MKRFARHILAESLAVLARVVIAKYRPTIVMVTGSVGKTSAKEASAAVLADSFFSRKSEKSFNTEFGVPFTIFGVKNPWMNPLSWLGVFREALALALLPNHYPNLLVLEVGADRPGDLERILSIATPDAVVVTRLPEVPVHVEAYATPEALREEEFQPAYALPPAAPLIISADDAHALSMAKRLPVRTLTYGVAKDADIRIFDIKTGIEDGVPSATASVRAGESVGQITLRGTVGRQQLFAAAAALALALSLEVPFQKALEALSSYETPPGRMRVFAGIHGSKVIDDSYNASPVALEEALAALAEFPEAKRRIAVLGDMLELGRYSVAEHSRLGAATPHAADIVVGVGIRMRALTKAAREAGMDEQAVLSFDNSKEALAALPSLVLPGDVILVKGSQSMRMERLVAGLLANPADAAKLVRQEREWKKRS
ncbi:MAG: UDP-N-acetylmuramoyl-tripeptide--D-alanyl-D-alanine ligase [Patescibacteria group bacterium]|nr:UDP-N-acetylmuramoyl-tripeptide--D-alanyl-D-alanine ligase [Patescibacteria group bacterium]MDE1965715.1 UDP-N-acetylmuramoyl-tripeptide--D-alanyl-D-alanine ligase [Patescibacteria group bacterium]